MSILGYISIAQNMAIDTPRTIPALVQKLIDMQSRMTEGRRYKKRQERTPSQMLTRRSLDKFLLQAGESRDMTVVSSKETFFK